MRGGGRSGGMRCMHVHAFVCCFGGVFVCVVFFYGGGGGLNMFFLYWGWGGGMKRMIALLCELF